MSAPNDDDHYEDDDGDGKTEVDIIFIEIEPLRQELVEIRALLERISYNFEQFTERKP